MLEHHSERWGDKVRIIGISIDKAPEVVVKHVQTKNWEKVEHFHRAGSSCSQDYGVNGVPHVVLVDTEGKIAYVGHPAGTNLEQNIETLLKGEKIATAASENKKDQSSAEGLAISKIKEELLEF